MLQNKLPLRIGVGVVVINDENMVFVGKRKDNPKNNRWQMPQGGVNQGENLLNAMKRELKEETGIVAETWEKIQTLHTSNSVTNESASIYLARNLAFGESKPESTEELQIRRVKLEEAIEMALSGKITDAMSVAGLLLVHAQKKQRGL